MAFGMPNGEAVARGYEMAERHFELLETQKLLLEEIRNGAGPGVQTLAIAEQEVPAGIEVDFPVEGSSRWIVPRLATGGSFEIPGSANPVEILSHNNRRLGGTIVNRGEQDVMLTLASAATAASAQGLGQIFLKAGGGSWDFRLGSLLWCGSICGRSLSAEGQGSIVTVVEV